MNDKGWTDMQQMIELHQGHVDEPMLAASLFPMAGAMASMGVGLLSPLAGGLCGSPARRRPEDSRST